MHFEYLRNVHNTYLAHKSRLSTTFSTRCQISRSQLDKLTYFNCVAIYNFHSLIPTWKYSNENLHNSALFTTLN